ncbi:hypothetical protein JOM56_009796 [Amanita muscaria]
MNIASKIPTEILGEIFLHAINGPISNIQDNSFPWAIDRVCKSWRYAFVNYPKLWTWITIDLAESYSRGQDLIAVNQCLSLCLERSKHNPLNISLHLPIEEYDEDNPFFTLVWQTFLSCSHRWRIMYLANVLEPQFVTLVSCTGATPILESLTILHGPMDIIDYSDFTGFQIAPRLTRFTLLHPAAMFAVQKWSVPWMQLTNLTLRFEEIICVDQLCVLLKQLRDIEELRLILEGDEPRIELSDFVHNSGTPQCLPHLRVLQVCCIQTLGLITAPSLSELYLEGSEFFYPQTLDGEPNEVLAEEILSSFIQRSSCKIHKLTLSDFSEHPFTPLVHAFPRVVELCLADAMPCLEDLLSLDQFPGLSVLDCTTHRFNARYFMRALVAILKLRNSSSATCSAAPLAKVIFRPMLSKDRGASVLVTTTDWASFESYVQVGSCCELNLTRQLWLPEEAPQSPPQSPPSATNGSSPSSSTLGAPLNPGPSVSQQPVLSGTLFPPDFVQYLSNSLDDFDSNIFRNDGDINFERDFGQWFNGDDVPLDLK